MGKGAVINPETDRRVTEPRRGAAAPNQRDWYGYLNRARKFRLCRVYDCGTLTVPDHVFCRRHQSYYEGGGLEHYVYLHACCCFFCGVPIERPGPIACGTHLNEFRRLLELAAIRDEESGLTAPGPYRERKLQKWLMYGPPLRLKAWEWEV